MKIKYMLVLFIITIVVPPVFSFSSLYEVIDINKLPQERDYISQVKWLIENPSVFRNGRSDGDSAASKDAAILKLKNILEQTNKYITKDSSNIELLLLRILLYWSFYGIAFSEYYNEIIDEGIRIERLFPKEYRTYWFLGTFFAYAARPLESIKQFDYVIKNLKVEKVHPQFWYSYASAAGFADMYKHALVALDKYALFEKEFKLDQDIVYKLSSYLTTPSFDSIIGPESLYQFQEREKGLGLLCRLFGIYMSVSKDWDVQTYEISNNGSMIVFTPEAILNKNDRAIRYSIFMEYNANKKIAFEEYIKKRLSKFDTYKKKEMILGNYPFIIYEVFKPNIYQEMGGFYGYLIFLKRKQPAVKGIGIEAPIVSMFNSETKQPYYRPNPAFDRYDGDIYYSIALDCCQDIFDKALKVLKEFVKEQLFD